MHQVPFSTKKQQLNIGLKRWRYFNWSIVAFMAFIHTTFYRLYLHWCILDAYSLYFVLSLHTRDSDWTVSKTHEQTRNTFNQIFAYFSIVLYTTIMKNVNLRNILANTTENYGRLEHLSGQNKSKILTFSIRRLDVRNDVLNETRTVERWF